LRPPFSSLESAAGFGGFKLIQIAAAAGAWAHCTPARLIGDARHEEQPMKRIRCIAGLTTLLALFASGQARASACPGVFVRDSPSYDNRNDRGELERVGVVVPKGTRDLIVGYTIVRGKTFYVQYRAYLHDPSDIRLKAGCVLGKYE
jgi:hypothetical protein